MFRKVTVALLLAMVLVSAIPAGAQEEENILRINWGTEPPSLDPSLSTDVTSHTIIDELTVGLGRQNITTAATEPGIATWTTEETEDTFIFTFTIMEGIPWVRYNAETGEVEEVLDEEGNVRYVTAHDIAYAFLRTFDPITAAQYAYVPADPLVGIKGAYEYNAADPEALSEDEMQALRDAVGITVIDDYTLQVESVSKVAFAIDIIAGMWFSNAQPSWLIEEMGDFWTEPENMQSYGPYALKEWIHEDVLTLIANPFWPGTEVVPQPAISEVTGVMITESSTAFAMYEAGEIDFLDDVPLGDLDRIKADPMLSEELYIGPRYCSYYYGFNVTQAPADNVHLRLALSYAVDRVALVENVTKGGQPPAQWFSRPGLVAAPTMENSPDLGIWYDPEAAQAELALFLEDMGVASVDELDPIIMMTNDLEGNIIIAEAIQQMWINELGIQVNMATQDWKNYLAGLTVHSPHVYRLGWCNDYFDANNFIGDVFRSTSGNNHTFWDDDDAHVLDELLDRAMVEPDPETRLDLYREAENYLVKEHAVIIPIYWYTNLDMFKPYIDSVPVRAGTNRFELWSLGEE